MATWTYWTSVSNDFDDDLNVSKSNPYCGFNCGFNQEVTVILVLDPPDGGDFPYSTSPSSISKVIRLFCHGIA